MRRAVITAAGLVAPQAMGVAEFWSRVKSGRSAIGRIQRFDATPTGCTIGGEVPTFDLSFIPAEMKARRMARHTVLLLKAAEQLRASLPANGQFGLRIGLATSDSTMIAQSGHRQASKGTEAACRFMVTQSPPHAAVGALGQFLSVRGEVQTVSTACAAGLDAIGLAARDIVEGRADCIVAGGADTPLGPSPLAEFVKCGLASLRNDSPETASRPFDQDADSGVLSDASCLVVIEDLDHALRRGSRILGEVLGYASVLDHDRSLPGSGYIACMRQALASASLDPHDIDYVSAWGPGHPVLDLSEGRAIAELLGRWRRDIPVTSIKGVTGNPLAAAGPLQVVAALESFREEIVAPIANLERPHAELELDFVMGEPLMSLPGTVLINGHGVGGSNASLVLAEPEPSWNPQESVSFERPLWN